MPVLYLSMRFYKFLCTCVFVCYGSNACGILSFRDCLNLCVEVCVCVCACACHSLSLSLSLSLCVCVYAYVGACVCMYV